MTHLAAIIVNYNSASYLARCLDALARELDGRYDWHAVVVDNASTDASAEAAGNRDRVRLVRAPSNLGFGAGANLGARHAPGDALLLLNPDACVTAGAVERLLEELAAHRDCAVVGPLVLNEDGTPQGNARGDPSILTGLFGRSSRLRGLFPGSRLARRNVVQLADVPAGAVSREVDWLSGACLLVRREPFDRVGGFDEGYFLFWEDADLCRRLRDAGWRVRFRVDAPVIHTGGRSTTTAPVTAIREFHRSAYRYYRTHVARGWWRPDRWLAAAALGARARWLLLRRVR